VTPIGSSGVGKSTLVNALVGDERLTTQEIRDVVAYILSLKQTTK
jgi:putative ribosome biogenesis GTPase RsgA